MRTLKIRLKKNDIKNIIKCIEEFSEKNGKDIPVITAGGIDSKESYLRQFDLGASGVQMGTKFVTTFECDAHEDYKKAYINCKEEDIVIVKSPVGMPGRAINNKFVKAVSDHKMPIKKCFSCIIPCKPDVAQYCITDALINAVQGNIDDALLFCGANTYKESKLKSVKEVLSEFS